MNLQLTKILIDIIKPKLNDVNIQDYPEIDNYHCNLININGIESLLITNNKTLFSFFIYDIDFENFIETIKQSVFKILVDLGFPQNQFEKILDSMETINYTKTSDRSVLASMNDMKKHIEIGLLFYKDSVLEINQRINDIPYKKNGHAKSTTLFQKLLEESRWFII